MGKANNLFTQILVTEGRIESIFSAIVIQATPALQSFFHPGKNCLAKFKEYAGMKYKSGKLHFLEFTSFTTSDVIWMTDTFLHCITSKISFLKPCFWWLYHLHHNIFNLQYMSINHYQNNHIRYLYQHY